MWLPLLHPPRQEYLHRLHATDPCQPGDLVEAVVAKPVGAPEQVELVRVAHTVLAGVNTHRVQETILTCQLATRRRLRLRWVTFICEEVLVDRGPLRCQEVC